MASAACVGDPTNHPGSIAGPGMPTVLIVSRQAAIQTDKHVCAMPPTAGPHPPGAFATASKTVLIGGIGALRQGDTSTCGAMITIGAPTVQIGD